MKSAFCFLFLLATTRLAGAQNLSGVWQGVETSPTRPGYWPAVLTLTGGAGNAFGGTLYQEDGGSSSFSVTFQLRGYRTAVGVQVEEVKILSQEVSEDQGWCQGSVAFTYDAAREKLTGRASYRPVSNCGAGSFELYRVKLKSPATVVAGALSTLRVSGRNVRWYADAALKRPLATGNSYRTKLAKTTTFYVTQGFYTTDRSPVVPIRVQVTPAARPASPAPVPAVAYPSPAPAPAPALPMLATPTPAPVVLPSVLFRQGTAELLPTASPALDELAATLLARSALRIRVAGHTDRLGDSGKNQLLSEQRAAAVQQYLARAGVAADRMEAVGYGDSRPLHPAPDARNQRVEITELK